MKKIEIKREKFNRLTIIKEVSKKRYKTRTLRRVLCECDCRVKKVFFLNSVRNGNTKSCGCLFKELLLKRMKKNNPTKKRSVRLKIKKARANQVFTKETRLKMSEIRKQMVGDKNPNWKGGGEKCIDCGEVRKKVYTKNKRCWECSKKYHVGKKHGNWKGTSTLNKYLRNSPPYVKWRTSIFKRDGYICQLCGKMGNRLEVDHYPKTFSKMLKTIKDYQQAFETKELWDIKNGRTLCKQCHKNHHKKYGYSNKKHEKTTHNLSSCTQ